jgi:hypothetical protein
MSAMNGINVMVHPHNFITTPNPKVALAGVTFAYLVLGSAEVQQQQPQSKLAQKPTIVCAVTDQRFMFSTSHHQDHSSDGDCDLSSLPFRNPGETVSSPVRNPAATRLQGLQIMCLLVSRPTQAQILVCHNIGVRGNRR